jgi:hypothetical protein
MKTAHVAIAFSVAATASLALVHLGSRAAHAQPKPEMRKWEQSCSAQEIMFKSDTGIVEKLNPEMRDKGQQGWELASLSVVKTSNGSITYTCFKRPIQ